MTTFSPGQPYEIGDIVSVEYARSRLAIWWDRIRLWRWNVPTREPRYFKVTSMTAGSMWPEVGDLEQKGDGK